MFRQKHDWVSTTVTWKGMGGLEARMSVGCIRRALPFLSLSRYVNSLSVQLPITYMFELEFIGFDAASATCCCHWFGDWFACQKDKGRTYTMLAVHLWHDWAWCVWKVRTGFNCTSELCLWAEKGQSWWCCRLKSPGTPVLDPVVRHRRGPFNSQRSPCSKPADAAIKLYVPQFQNSLKFARAHKWPKHSWLLFCFKKKKVKITSGSCNFFLFHLEDCYFKGYFLSDWKRNWKSYIISPSLPQPGPFCAHSFIWCEQKVPG